MRIAVIICSVGRPDALAALMPWLARQSKPAARVLLVVTKAQDLPSNAALVPCPGVEVIFAPRGLPAQRNRGLDHLRGDCDLVMFMDDDYLPSRDALMGVERAFAAFPMATGLTGLLLADGIHHGGLSSEEGATLIRAYEGQERPAQSPRALRRDLVGLYGCNMAFRHAAIGDTRFDERLPLYGWQEDVDFAARLPGENIATDGFVGVHCGLQSGREQRGRALGYSQVANAHYLWRKGSLPGWFVLRLILRNLLANHVKALRPEPWIDRRGRLTGNWIALRDMLAGRDDPMRILDLGPGPS
jgi:glycosyltransferase involved in cell wall biosynthesis